MTYSIIQKSQLEGAQRLDAEYYQPEYLKLAENIRSLHNKSLKQIAIIRSGTTPTDRDDELTEGVILLKTTDIRNNILSYNDNYYHITSKISGRMSKTKLNANDVLVNIVGATLEVIGRASLVPNNFPESNITQAMALLRIEDPNFLPEFIFSFLMSRYGQFQADRLARPTGQFNLNLEELGQILIPQVFLHKQENIAEIIKKVIKSQEESNKSYKQAEELLLEELGLTDFKSSEDLWSIVNFSDVQKVRRLDADFFQQKYKVIIEKIEKFKTLDLSNKNYFNIITGTYSKSYSDKGANYIRSVNMQNDLSIDRSNMYKTIENLGDKFKVKIGDIITSRVGSIGTLGIISEELDGSFISDNILRIRNSNKELNNLFLAFYLKKIGSIIMEKLSRGSVQQRLNQETLREIILPVLPMEAQEKIAELIKKSHEARKKSKELLEEAKRKVEKMIEKGGDTS